MKMSRVLRADHSSDVSHVNFESWIRQDLETRLKGSHVHCILPHDKGNDRMCTDFVIVYYAQRHGCRLSVGVLVVMTCLHDGDQST